VAITGQPGRRQGSIRSRLAVSFAVVIAVVAVGLVASRLAVSSPPRPVHASLPHAPASYLGVYAPGTPRAYGHVAGFAAMAGERPNLVGYYSGWYEPFASSFARLVRRHGAATVVQIDPTDISLRAIAAGDYDSYLRSYADSVRDFGHPVVIGFGHEMNGTWYSWGYGHVPAAVFVAAWRHIVTVFRAQGADNVTWMWTINDDARGTGPVRSWWPGRNYVTWVGIDGYYVRPSDTFAGVFGSTIDQVRAFTSKPVLLAETAAGPAAGQAAKIGDLFAGVRRYHTLGLVWFDYAQDDGIYRQDWQIPSHSPAQAAFQRGISTLSLTRPSGS
jgi:mannan endo-1,4-beta-mannosidase